MRFYRRETVPGRELRPEAPFRLAAAFGAVYVIWGSTYLAIRFAIESMPPFLMAGSRFLIAGVVLYGYTRARGAPAPHLRHWASATIAGALMMAMGNGLVTWSEQTVPSGVAAVVVGTLPLWMTFLEVWPFRRAHLTLRTVAGLICGLAGVAILIAPTGSDLRGVSPWAVAVLLFASLAWALGSLLSRSLDLPRSPGLIAAMQMTAGGTILVGTGTVLGEWGTLELARVTPRSALAFAYLVVFGSMVALAAYQYLMSVTSAAAVSTYAFVNPVVAVVLGWSLAGEPFGPREMLATLLVVGSVAAGLRATFAGRARRIATPPGDVLSCAAEAGERSRCRTR